MFDLSLLIVEFTFVKSQHFCQIGIASGYSGPLASEKHIMHILSESLSVSIFELDGIS
jgi:hypothetical protein